MTNIKLSQIVRKIGKSNLPSPNTYDELERWGSRYHPIPLAMAYQPVSYQSVNFPTHVRFEEELAKFADHNYEGEVPSLYDPDATFAPIGYVNRFTLDERTLIAEIRDQVAKMTASRCGRAVRPATNLLVQTGPFRAISHIADVSGAIPLRVFEAGPGAGYLGAMLATKGHTYRSFDVTQSYYLWQNRLLNMIADKNFVELADAAHTPPKLPQVAHIPWWLFTDYVQKVPFQVDLVYSNSNLCEMSPLSLKIFLTVANKMLAESKVGLFVYFSTGMPAQTQPDTLPRIIESHGLKQVCDAPFHAFARNPDIVADIIKSFADGIPFHDPSGRGGHFTANDVVAFKEDEAPLDTFITSWDLGWKPPFRH